MADGGTPRLRRPGIHYPITTIANTGNSQHAGTLTITNVEALTFHPTVDPTSHPRTLESTGDTLELLGPIPNRSEPATIDNGATLELATPDAGTVTFAEGRLDCRDRMALMPPLRTPGKFGVAFAHELPMDGGTCKSRRSCSTASQARLLRSPWPRLLPAPSFRRP